MMMMRKVWHKPYHASWCQYVTCSDPGAHPNCDSYCVSWSLLGNAYAKCLTGDNFWRWYQQTSKLVSSISFRAHANKFDLEIRIGKKQGSGNQKTTLDPFHVQTPNQGHKGTHARTKKTWPQTYSHLLVKLMSFRCNIFHGNDFKLFLRR